MNSTFIVPTSPTPPAGAATPIRIELCLNYTYFIYAYEIHEFDGFCFIFWNCFDRGPAKT